MNYDRAGFCTRRRGCRGRPSPARRLRGLLGLLCTVPVPWLLVKGSTFATSPATASAAVLAPRQEVWGEYTKLRQVLGGPDGNALDEAPVLGAVPPLYAKLASKDLVPPETLGVPAGGAVAATRRLRRWPARLEGHASSPGAVPVLGLGRTGSSGVSP